MIWNWFSVNVNGNWIDFQTSGKLGITIVIRYNDEIVVTERMGAFSSRHRSFEFEGEEDGSNVRYLVEMIPLYRTLSFILYRDGVLILTSQRTRKKIPPSVDLDTPARCYTIQDSGEVIEIAEGAVNLDSSSVYCFVHNGRKTIYLWRGRNAGFRMRILGTEAADALKKQFGRDFRIQYIDEGAEPAGFMNVVR
ncbi:MAG: hypothetical protein ACFFEJ_16825 [Candidatus Thorarchaeota archaeon]